MSLPCTFDKKIVCHLRHYHFNFWISKSDFVLSSDWSFLGCDITGRAAFGEFGDDQVNNLQSSSERSTSWTSSMSSTSMESTVWSQRVLAIKSSTLLIIFSKDEERSLFLMKLTYLVVAFNQVTSLKPDSSSVPLSWVILEASESIWLWLILSYPRHYHPERGAHIQSSSRCLVAIQLCQYRFAWW